ncbi:putative ATP-dependent helicase [Lachnellula willkommii]|uniref:Putative ATP-dependent helicase n=1 Tax=Lachnellula willkommii TaxID=215461 RepID=A0A559MHK8_9HELO|nr:putative ATP-dependent helicase [Lachnellula willkommii]
MRGAFTPHNTLGSRENPTFTQPRLDQQQDPPDFPRTIPRTTEHLEWDRQSDSEASIKSFYIPGRLSDFGDSSSLFSNTPPPPSFDFTEGIKTAHAKSPVPFVFGASQKEYTISDPRRIKMVNERSPAKAPLNPVEPNDQAPRTAESAFPSKPPSSVPQFGQPTLPNSPFNRSQHQPQFQPQTKPSALFIQPKSRPEHHRDAPAHPHLQAMKDATRKVVDPFLPRAPAVYNTAVPAPMSTVPSYTTTKPMAAPSFGSSGNVYGGFQSVNPTSNYIDLTTNQYRTSTIPDPFTFVDPAKAQEDLKALLEGVMEDEDDVPKTRSRRKRKDAEVDSLAAKLKGLDVEEEKLEVASDDEEDDGTVEGIKVKLLPHQVEGLEWMTGRELGTGKKGRVPKGGILADDMGLGKTLQSIALILNNPKPTDEDVIAKRKLPSGVEKCTLVVAPLALIRQWEAEIKDKVASSHSLRVIVHHGPQRTKRFQDLKKYDVVITTYQIMVSEFGNSSDSDNGIKVGCFGLHWYRVILDEAHTIKNRNAKATQACYALRSEYRWCLTGTPMQNNLEELQSLIKFLRIKPYDDLREFKDQIDRPLKNGRGDVAIKRLRAFLKIFMKRRTKDILTKEGALNPGGKPSAPGEENTTGFKVTTRKIEKISAMFSPEERRFYERLEQRTDASIEQMMSGEKVNYASALVLLLRLRQACNHPKLVAGKLAKDSEALAGDTSSQKAKASNADVDEIADMFGALGVGSKKCEVCQLELGKQATADGAIRCLDCEADLEDVSKKPKSRKDKKKKKKKNGVKSEAVPVVRKPRNRAVITDSDDENDENEEGSWVVPEAEQGSLKLGKAGGLADENAEGGGEWLDSDDDTFPDLQHIGALKKPIKVDTSDSGSDDDEDEDETDSDEEVEDEFQSDSDEEAQLATMVTSTKITHLIQILGKEITEHKFIVFSQFTSMLDLIEPFLRQKGFKFTRYDGSMRNDHREASLSKLRNDKNCRILLCSLKCGSLGLNLTAATRVVILEPFWNPFVEEQAIDRVHRLTQKIDVIVYKITIADSVEERILDLQEKKRELANQTLEGGKGAAGKFGMQEILQLFRRDAEHAPPGPAAAQYDLGSKPRILKDGLNNNSGSSSREASQSGARKVTPPTNRPTSSSTRENDVYSRRW